MLSGGYILLLEAGGPAYLAVKGYHILVVEAGGSSHLVVIKACYIINSMLLFFASSPGQTKTKEEPLNVQQKSKEKINGESDMCGV